MRGVVKFFNPTRGFGFIYPNEAGKPDVFVHATSIINGATPMPGDEVSYETCTDDRSGRIKATNVRIEKAV